MVKGNRRACYSSLLHHHLAPAPHGAAQRSPHSTAGEEASGPCPGVRLSPCSCWASLALAGRQLHKVGTPPPTILGMDVGREPVPRGTLHTAPGWGLQVTVHQNGNLPCSNPLVSHSAAIWALTPVMCCNQQQAAGAQGEGMNAGEGAACRCWGNGPGWAVDLGHQQVAFVGRKGGGDAFSWEVRFFREGNQTWKTI